MARFLDVYWSDQRQRPRIERILAFGRTFLAVTALGAIYLDPTEPTRFATLTYTLLAAYAFYSAAVLVWIRRRHQVSARSAQVLHGIDLLFASAITFFSAGPISPFFLFFLFATLSAAYRWGFRETVATAVIASAIFLAETLVAAFGPWRETMFSDLPEDLGQTILRITYLLLTGVLLGYLADQEKQIRAEMAATADAMRQPSVAAGVGGSASAIARLLGRLFDARSVDIVLHDHETERTSLWQFSADSAVSEADATRTLELDPRQRAAWLFDAPLRAWCSLDPIADDTIAAWGFDADGRWSFKPVPLTLRTALTDARDFRALAAVDLGLPGEWRGRVLLFDPAQMDGSQTRVQFLSVLAEYLTPIVSNILLLGRLRTRASAAERARVARDLHDGAIQALIGIEMETEALRRHADRDASSLVGDIEHIQQLLRREVVSLRELMQELRPADLDAPHHLGDALSVIVERFRRDTGTTARFQSTASTAQMPLKMAVEVARMTQEALVNVRKHSGASRVVVELQQREGGWVLIVDDNGRGFDFAGRLEDDALRARWGGPATLMERARLVGGRVLVDSRPGEGARIEVDLDASAVA